MDGTDITENGFAMEREDGFSLGNPSLVCRWRLAGGKLLLANRHLRALGERTVAGEHVSRELVAWTKQHIEWTLAEGSAKHPDGVLMLLLDESGKAAMCVGEYTPLKSVSAVSLLERARSSAEEAAATGVAPETLWRVDDDRLLVGMDPSQTLSGAASFVSQLAGTLGVPLTYAPDLLEQPLTDRAAKNSFLVSDEHGIACSFTARDGRGSGELTPEMRRVIAIVDSYGTLFEKTKNNQ